MSEPHDEKNAGAKPRGGLRSKLRSLLLLVLAIAILAVVAWVAGRQSGRGDLEQVRAASVQDMGAERSRAQALESEVTRLTAAGHLLAAKASLVQARSDLHDRNFGTAQERVRDAASELDGLARGPGARVSDGGRLDGVRRAVASVSFDASTDAEAQGNRLAELSRQVSDLSPR